MQLNLPEYAFRLRKREDRNEIFDEIRKKWLVCTPEEWVRQHFIKWLISAKNYPASNVAIEGGLTINQLQKRTDIVCYFNNKPLLLVECKAPAVKLDQTVFDQLFRYNLQIQSPLLAVTNGMQHIFAQFNGTELTFLKDLPAYPNI